MQAMLIQMNLSEDEIRELNYKRFHENHPMLQKRLHAVYLKASLSMSSKQIALIVDVRRNSVDNWIHMYGKEGLSGLMLPHYTARKSELTPYSEMIRERFSETTIQTVKEFAGKTESLTGIKRSLTQVRRFIKKSGFRHLQSGHIPCKADPQKQRQWKEKYWIWL
jgi:transposase